MISHRRLFKVLFFIAMISGAQSLKAQNIQPVSQLPYNYLANVWGYVDSTGKEYALLGADDGLSIVDISDPVNPVEVFHVPGPMNEWREIRNHGKYVYMTTEGGTGVTIVDMRNLPDGITSKQYTGDGAVQGMVDDIHALHIDNGKLYLYGGTLHGGKAKIFSLNDPWNPVYLGTVTESYVHDGYVLNDTLYSCQIYDGEMVVVDARDPQNPVIINSQTTPLQFPHNSWMSTDKKVMYTTDERPSSYVTAYDITDLSNIKELDRYRHDNSGSIGHNTYILNNPSITGHNTDYLWTSYYTDGVTLVDAARPDNLVEVGHYDTSPYGGPTFQGAWGVYPYLPSGKILISDRQTGLHVLAPTYTRAAYLEGLITNSVTGTPVFAAKVEIIDHKTKDGKLDGTYKTGIAEAGNKQVKFSANGYITQTVFVDFVSAQVTNLNIQLEPTSIGVDQTASGVCSVYPSIVNDKFFIENKTYEKFTGKVVDQLGKIIMTMTISANNVSEINMTNVKAGIYYVVTENTQGITNTEKIIVQ